MQAAWLKEKSYLRLSIMLEKTLEAPAIRTRRNVLMFLIPSLIGILLFMTPVIYDGNVTIPVAVLAKLVQTVFADYLVAMVSAIITTTMLMTLIAWLFKPAILVKRPFLNSLFNVSPSGPACGCWGASSCC